MGFIHKMYILNFVREFVRICPKPSNFVRRLKNFCPKMSENIKSYPCQHTPQTASLFVFIRKNASKNQRVRIFIRLKALMKIYENNSHQYINPYRPLKMHKHTKNKSTQKSICPKTNPKYSFDTPKFLVRISQTFVRVLSEKNILGQNFGHFRTKCP